MIFYFMILVSMIQLVLSALNQEQCESVDPNTLFSYASEVADEADAALVPGVFSRVVKGFFLITVDEEDGQAVGGETNPFGVYGVFAVDGSEIFPEGMCNIINHDGNYICSKSDNTTVSFSLGPADAIVFYGCTPPPVEYFSFDPIISVRLTQECPFYPGMNFGDSISQYNINTSTYDNNDVFNKPVLVIHTPDQKVAEDVSNAFINYGKIEKNSISVRGVPSETVRLWDRSEGQSWEKTNPDIMGMIFRMSVPKKGSEEEWERYKTAIFPVHYYYADDEKKSENPINPVLVTRESDELVNETTEYLDSFESLKNEIMNQFMSDNKKLIGNQTVNYTVQGYYDDWEKVLNLETNDSYTMPTRDALYGMPKCNKLNACKFDNKTSGVLMGLIHSKTYNAAYSSIGLDIMNLETGQFLETYWFLDSDLLGSAERYIPNDPKNQFFFAIDFLLSRECSNNPNPQWCVELNNLEHSEHALLIAERIYSTKSTKIGPPAVTTIPSAFMSFRSI